MKKIISVMLSIFMVLQVITPLSVFAESTTTVTVGSVTDYAGEVVDVPITIEGNPGILGATLTVSYDSGITLVDAVAGDAFSTLTMTKPGKLISPCNFVWDGQDIADEDIKDGTVLTLQFQISEDAQADTRYNVTVSYEDGDIVNAYLNPVNPVIVNGTVEVMDFKYGDLNEDKKVNTTDVILMRRHIAGGYEQTIKEKAADVNVDEKTNTTDVILTRRYIAGGYDITLPYVPGGCNHVMEATPAKEATQEEEGNIAYWYCKACNKYFSDEKGTTEITLADTVLPALPADEYAIQYMCDMVPLDENGNAQSIPDDVYSPTKTKVLADPKMDTYTFLGWSDKDGKMYGKELPVGTTGDLTLYANWASNRNKAVPKSKIGDPIICEDSENGQILFVYEIGRIENVPIFETQDLLIVNGLITSTGIVKQKKTEKTDAQTIGQRIANTTTDSTTWTFSKDWEETLSISQAWLEQQEKSETEAKEFSKNSSNTYNVMNSSGGSSSLINNDSSSYRISANQAHIENTYDEEQKYTAFNIDGKVSNSTTVSAGINAGLKIPLTGAEGNIGAEVNASNTFAWEISAGYEDKTYTKNVTTGTDSWEKNVDIANSQSSTATAEKTWNSSQGFSSSESVSSSSTVAKAVSELISREHSEDTTYTTGGSNGEMQESASSKLAEDLNSSTVTISTEEMEISERKFESNGNTYGAYRLVQTGMARVFAVVGYDIKEKAYYTYTHSVLDDDEYKEYLDYSYDRSFTDYETSTLPFEIPIFVNDYVNSRIASSKLQIDDNGIVQKYLGSADDEVILIPSYYTKVNSTTGETELITVKGIAPRLFENNTNIVGVSLGNFVNEIPESAFAGCTSLKEIICPNVVRIGANAFNGCSSLSEFAIPDEVESIGEGAFDGVSAIRSNAPTIEIANAVAKANAKNISLDISKIEADDFSDMAVEVGEIETFKLLGGRKEYKGLNISSDAHTTIISGITISECDGIPIEVSSPNVTLERVTVQSDGFALVLKADETTLSLEGVSSMISEGDNSIIAKNISFVLLNDETYSIIDTDKNVLICGEVANNDSYIDEDKIIYITDEEYINYLTSRKITFNANGGSVDTESISVPLNEAIGKLPVPYRDYYTFDGWYTELNEDDSEEILGEKVTEETILTDPVDIEIYARWIHNDVSAWTLAEEVPEDAEIVDTKYTYDLTTETTSSSSSLSGYTLYNTTYIWGGWSGWINYDPGTNNGNRETQTQYIAPTYKTQWRYSGYYNPSTTYSTHCATCGGSKNSGAVWIATDWLDYQVSATGYTFNCPNVGTVTEYSAWTPSYGNKKLYTVETRQVETSAGYTQWQYRDKIFTYYFRKVENKESSTYPEGENISNIQEWVQYRLK